MTHHVHELRYFQSKIHFDDVAGIQHRANPFLITLEQVSEEGVFMFSYRTEPFSGCESHPGTWIGRATEQLIQHPAPGTFIRFPSADSAEAVKWGALHPTLHLHPNSLYHTGKTRVFSSLCTHMDPGSITYSLHLALHVRSHRKCQLLIEMYIAYVLVPSWHLEFIFCQLVVYTCCHYVIYIYIYAIIVCVLYTQVILIYIYICCINTHMHVESHYACVLLYTYMCVTFVCVLFM